MCRGNFSRYEKTIKGGFLKIQLFGANLNFSVTRPFKLELQANEFFVF